MNEELLDFEIRRRMAFFKANVEILRGLNRLDVNIVSENILVQLLALVFSWLNLKNLNEAGKTNVETVDLGDEVAHITVQVTSKRTSKKVTDTLNGFAKHRKGSMALIRRFTSICW